MSRSSALCVDAKRFADRSMVATSIRKFGGRNKAIRAFCAERYCAVIPAVFTTFPHLAISLSM